jgi:hypothetical protein
MQNRNVGPEGTAKGVGSEAEELVVVVIQQEVLVDGNEDAGVGGSLGLDVVQGRGVGHELAAERRVQQGLGVEAVAEGLVVVVVQQEVLVVGDGVVVADGLNAKVVAIVEGVQVEAEELGEAEHVGAKALRRKART